MRIWAAGKNLVRYGRFSLMPQVDPEVMRPIFKDAFAGWGVSSDDDVLALYKQGMGARGRGSLIFRYSPISSGSYFAGRIYAGPPRESFDHMDVLSCIRIDVFMPDEKGGLFDVVKNIVKNARIERVVISTDKIKEADADRLREFRGMRSTVHMQRYGLEPSL